jgi:hypothetical protein
MSQGALPPTSTSTENSKHRTTIVAGMSESKTAIKGHLESASAADPFRKSISSHQAESRLPLSKSHELQRNPTRCQGHVPTLQRTATSPRCSSQHLEENHSQSQPDPHLLHSCCRQSWQQRTGGRREQLHQPQTMSNWKYDLLAWIAALLLMGMPIWMKLIDLLR